MNDDISSYTDTELDEATKNELEIYVELCDPDSGASISDMDRSLEQLERYQAEYTKRDRIQVYRVLHAEAWKAI